MSQCQWHAASRCCPKFTRASGFTPQCEEKLKYFFRGWAVRRSGGRRVDLGSTMAGDLFFFALGFSRYSWQMDHSFIALL